MPIEIWKNCFGHHLWQESIGIESILTKKKAIRCNGRIYSEEHRRKFDIKNDIFKIEKNPTDDSKLMLTIDKQPIGEWFKEQWEKFRRGLRQSAGKPRK